MWNVKPLQSAFWCTKWQVPGLSGCRAMALALTKKKFCEGKSQMLWQTTLHMLMYAGNAFSFLKWHVLGISAISLNHRGYLVKKNLFFLFFFSLKKTKSHLSINTPSFGHRHSKRHAATLVKKKLQSVPSAQACCIHCHMWLILGAGRPCLPPPLVAIPT